MIRDVNNAHCIHFLVYAEPCVNRFAVQAKLDKKLPLSLARKTNESVSCTVLTSKSMNRTIVILHET